MAARPDVNLAGIHEKDPLRMSNQYSIIIHWRQQGHTFSHKVSEGDYILKSFERKGALLPFNCRNGCCTTCAIRVINGNIDHKEAFGLSREVRSKGYGLLCVASAQGSLEVETQDEDEVYETQFGRFFGCGKLKTGLPIDEG
ncbi:Ferredoxin (chromatophore) [Paulinella micropora]|uniref:Ferredoxin n=1 Tax=Paulinella micropora TaxID=1928728 RepID=A0A1L5YB89_9EUKA|nr:ferredoxin (2Fe-2S) [Paulinella micropora]AQX44721.1 Ferredoxin (2Fe-2S) [Paulinella micropora]BBL85933.1 Ferredoxin [Paulinella micropora]